METAEIRRRWLTFFEKNGHAVVPSAPLIHEDPNLLFVNAGMVQFKPYFLGQESAPWKRATSVQKCVRTQDIEEVGKTSRHGTFFQMNGNFSFGDYFKEGAIKLAWDLSTTSQESGGFGLDGDRLWATVYEDDEEAIELWVELTDIPMERIVRRGKADNYWHMGVPGPGGPCSEIYYDRGPEYGPEGGPAVDEDRFLEYWNLVFMQHELGEVRSKVDFDILGDLPHKNIDTGMGLERMASLLQGVDNMYEIDEVYPVLARAAEMTGKTYGARSGQAASESHPDDVHLRVVADHIRSSLMLIGDGVTPSNEGRGYVLRRMLRRSVRAMRILGYRDPCLPELLPISLERMQQSYPELEADWERISAIAYAEEEAFRRTLASGTTILDTAVAETKQGGSSVLSGERAFQLHDTYGFPIDLTLEMAAEQGLSVDREGFTRLMQEQRDRAKADAMAKKVGHGGTGAYREIADMLGRPVEFTGYDEVSSEARIAGLIREGAPVGSAWAGDEIEVVLDRTPFYAEGGGQLADGGLLQLGGGAVIEVRDVQSPITGLIVHKATVVSGEVHTGEITHALVDIERRRSISRAHTATHMVHKAIREALGETATQAGSENSPGRFRFDFKATSAVPPSVLRDVEQRVNAILLEDLAVSADVMSQAEAREIGAMAMFGEKYGDEVRVISVGEWAKELCGGTHAERTTQLGLVTLLGESSIGSGVRRVEALVGADAYSFLAREKAIVGQLGEMLKARPEELPERISTMITRLKEAERDLDKLRKEQVLAAAARLTDATRDVGAVRFLGHDAGAEAGADEVRAMVLDARGRLGTDRPVVVAVTGTKGGRPVVVVATNEAARGRGIKAGELVRIAAQQLGGGGGGKDDLAQGGGSNAEATTEALAAIEWRVGELAD
ncbi:MAG TPA: alanine--tRNA ligase [Intrasporangiaceae bacterium]|nr:alanine--tRNA ligase [Intrasporangiaceae bacterium]